MFNKILIANRGEIACRIMRTAKKLGIRCVAVYSAADRNALHVQQADEAYYLGPAAVTESYLQGAKIVQIAKQCGAQAIHPGYGFLSENPEFVAACQDADITFIGPSASAIEAMGLKDAAKTLMEQAQVPVVPGYHGSEQNPDFLAERANWIGYPVLIKARAGGGGKGMRRVETSEQFLPALQAAQREGKASFNDERVLIEKYINKPRHIEIQIFADRQHNAVYLFERDCSLQRRHQKVIEEAPAPDMNDTMRTAMGEAAVQAALAVGYQGAGTVEFIVDASDGLQPDRFYFMEMNTRLQVEHPVTEAITGLDLVEWQLRIAWGQSLPLRQEQLAIHGHAFEARIYAEDPAHDFLPATGTLDYLSWPEQDVRIDTGVQQGDVITPYYDPMLAKLIVHGPDRNSALNRLAAALNQVRIVGCINNVGFLSRLARQPAFRLGDVDTGLIERNIEHLSRAPAPSDAVIAIAALAALGLFTPSKEPDPWVQLRGWRQWGASSQFVHLSYQGKLYDVEINTHHDGYHDIRLANQVVQAKILGQSGTRVRVDVQDRIVTATVLTSVTTVTLFAEQDNYYFELPDHLAEQDEADSDSNQVIAPMPGLIQQLKVEQGQTVAKGEVVLIMEAMKMELSLTAPCDGEVAELNAAVGDQVTEGTILLRLKSA